MELDGNIFCYKELIYSINRIIAFVFLDGIMRLREFSINPLGDQLLLDSHR